MHPTRNGEALPSSGPSVPAQALPYAIERILAEGGGLELERLEAQNRLFERDRPLDHLPPLPLDAAILDLGSGTGFWAQRLAARIPQGRLTCLDRAPDLLARTASRLVAAGLAAPVLLRQDLASLDLPEAGFDLVFTCMTLAHAGDLGAVIPALARALKPGGWLVSFEPAFAGNPLVHPHPPCPNLAFLQERFRLEAEARGTDFASALAAAAFAERAGLSEVEVRHFGGALRGAEAEACVRDALLPLFQAWLGPAWDPDVLAQRCQGALTEAAQPGLWLDLPRTVTRARRPR